MIQLKYIFCTTHPQNSINNCKYYFYATHLFNIDALCLSCFFAKYNSFWNNVNISKQNSKTNSNSITTNNTKPRLLTSNHQFLGQSPITVYISGNATAYKIGSNQLMPIMPRIPGVKCIFGLFLVSNSDCIIRVIPIRVDVPSSNKPAKLELIIPCQFWKRNGNSQLY